MTALISHTIFILLILTHICVKAHEHDIVFLVDNSNMISEKQCIRQQKGIISYFREFHDMNLQQQWGNVLSYYTFNKNGEINKIIDFDDEKYIEFEQSINKIMSSGCNQHKHSNSRALYSVNTNTVNTYNAFKSALNVLNNTKYKHTKSPRILLFNNFADKSSENKLCEFFKFNNHKLIYTQGLKISVINFLSNGIYNNYLKCLTDKHYYDLDNRRFFEFNNTSYQTFLFYKEKVIESVCYGGGLCAPCGSTSYYCSDPNNVCSWTSPTPNPPPGVCIPTTTQICVTDIDCPNCMRCCTGQCVYNGDARIDDCGDGRGDCCSGDLCINATCLTTVTNFGILIGGAGHSATDGIVIVTLWYDSLLYQCTIYPPVSRNRLYTCDQSSFTILGPYCDDTSHFQILVDNSNTTDGVGIVRIIVTSSNGILYNINNFCIDSTTPLASHYGGATACKSIPYTHYNSYSSLCIDNEPLSISGSCGPGKELFTIYNYKTVNTSTYIDAIWTHGMNIPIDVGTCNPTSHPTFDTNSPTYTPTMITINPTIYPTKYPTKYPTN
eukprot:178605_1